MPELPDLADALRLACQTSYVPKTRQGRKLVLAMPREWVLANIATVAEKTLDLSDDWDYARFLELLVLFDESLLKQFVASGLTSQNLAVREIAEDYRKE
jgi:hypothetical protein